jgi:copper(I)-binding protein
MKVHYNASRNFSFDFGIDNLFNERYFLFHRFPGRPTPSLPDTRFDQDRASKTGKEIPMKNMTGGLFGTLLLACLLAATARAEEVKAGDLIITQAWTRATPKGAKIGGGYLTIENKGTAPDTLLGGSADIAGSAQVHEMSMDNGVMKMRALDKGLTIEPRQTVKLAPGGYHLMMMDLKSPLKRGDEVPVTLDFEKAGKVAVSLDVQGVGAQAPAGGGDMGGMNMKKM